MERNCGVDPRPVDNGTYRIENMFFEGVPQPVKGALQPDLSRPGLGLEFKRQDAKKYEVA